jgi:hypothetical protein
MNWTNWAEIDSQIRRLEEKYKEFDGEIWRRCRSAPKTTDLWIKTTNNSTNPEIQIRAIFFWGKFFGEIFWAKLVESEGQIRGNLCSDTI